MTIAQPTAPLWQQTTFRRHRTGILRAMTLSLLAATTLVIIAAPALGQTVWTGAQNQNWATGTNWNTNAAPTAADDVEITTTTPNTPVIDGISATTNWLRIGTAAGNGSLAIVNGGDLVANNHISLGDNLGASGLLNISGAGSTISMPTNGIGIGDYGVGVLNLSNGASITTNGGIGLGYEVGAHGTLNIDNASYITQSNLYLGGRGAGQLSLANGGLLRTINGFVGFEATGDGSATVDGPGSRWEATGYVTVGSYGQGQLAIRNGGTVIADLGLYAGTQIGSTGMVQITGPGSQWRTTASAEIGSFGQGALTLADGGTLWVGNTLTIAARAGSTGTLNIGAAAGDAAAAPGTIANVGTVNFGAGTGTFNFNHTGSNYTFNPNFVGTGTINHLAGTTTLVNNSQLFNGTLNVTGGKLLVNNRIGGVVNVSGGGIFGGNAEAIGPLLNIQSAGVLSPGNSIGAITTVDVTFSAGSFYDVEVNAAGQADKLNAQNTAQLNGGTVRVSASPDHVLDQAYSILFARAGVTGTFDKVTTSIAFVKPVLTYGLNDVFLTLYNALDMGGIAETPNQQEVASSLDDLGPNNEVVQTFANETPEDTLKGFDDLSGEIHPSISTTLIDGAKIPRDAVLERSGADDEQLWAIVQGSHLAVAGDGNAAALTSGRFDVIGGIDDHLGDWRVGFLLQGGMQHISIPDRSSTASIGNPGLGAYARGKWGGTGLDLGGTVTAHDINTTRNVVIGNFSDQLRAHYLGVTGQLFGRFSQELELPEFTLVPYGEAAYVVTATNGFTEQGGPAALTVAGAVNQAVVTTLGFNIERETVLDDGSTLTFKAGLGWQHIFASKPQTANILQGQNFTVTGVGLPQDALVLDAGLEWQQSDSTRFGLAYDGTLSQSAQSHAIKANFATEF